MEWYHFSIFYFIVLGNIAHVKNVIYVYNLKNNNNPYNYHSKNRILPIPEKSLWSSVIEFDHFPVCSLNILLINSLFFYNIMYIYFLKKLCLYFNFSISMNGIILYTFFLFLSLLQFLRFIQMMHSVAVYSFHCWMLIQCEIVQQFIIYWMMIVGWLVVLAVASFGSTVSHSLLWT